MAAHACKTRKDGHPNSPCGLEDLPRSIEPLTSDNYHFTLGFVIRSFKHRGLKRLYERGDRSGIRLHPLKGDLKGFWSVTLRANWRIIFRLKERMLLTLKWLTTIKEEENPCL